MGKWAPFEWRPPVRASSWLIACWLGGGLLIAACGAAKTGSDDFGAYRQNLKQMYVDGMDALASANYTEAKKLFQQLSGESRYVGYSVLAKLRLGDTLLAEGEYESAELVYEEFLQQYRGDPNEAYAHWRKCQARDERIPGDWVILPPPESKDMTPARRAYVCYRDFVDRHIDSRFLPVAQERYVFTRGLLYRHERYVMDYYWFHDQYGAVTERALGILKDYPEQADEELYRRLVLSLVESQDLTRATHYLTEYTSNFPGGRFGTELRARLDREQGAQDDGKAEDAQPAG